MSEPKWTEGTWYFDDIGTPLERPDGLGYLKSTAHDEVQPIIDLGHIGDSGLPAEENIANAHLIAAAPDLYEALLTCQEYLATSLGSASNINPYPLMDEALAKANGNGGET